MLFLVPLISLSLFFLFSLRITLSIYRRYIHCWRFLFLLVFLMHTAYGHLRDVRPYESSFVFFYSDSVVEVFLATTLRMVQSILRAQMFIPLIRFLLCRLVSNYLLVLQRYSFLNFFFRLHLFMFPSLRVVWFFPDLFVLFLPSFVVFRFSLLAWHIFQTKFHLYILTV